MIRKNFSEYTQVASDKKSSEYSELENYLGAGRKHNIYIRFSDGKEFFEKNKGQIYTSLKSIVPLVKEYLLSKELPSEVDLDDLDRVCRLNGWGKGVPTDIAILGNFISYLAGEEDIEVKRKGSPNERYQGFNSGLDLSDSFIEIWNDNIEGNDLNESHELVGEEDGEEEGRIANQLIQYSNIIIEGVAGSGKSHILQKLRKSGDYGKNGSQIEVVVFHPSTSYEEFVSGIRPNFSKQEGESDFVTQEGIFVQMCNRAVQDPDSTYLLFIDEINRANTSRVFGDLMLVLEKSKRQEFKDLPQEGRSGALFEAAHQNMPGDYVRLQTPIFKNGKEYNKLAVPANLHVLGTMNTTDRSVGTIDLALRRRFHWVTQHPFTAEELQAAMEENGEDYPEEIASWYENTNTILLNKVGPDARLGHAYFFGKDGDEEAIAEALLNQLKEVAFTFNISQTILDDIGPVHGQKIITRGSGLGARPDIVEETYQG